MMKFDKYELLGDYHWQAWQDKSSIYSRHAQFCQLWIKERPCLDVGCGDGLITHLLGSCVIGLDNVLLAVELARKHGVNAFVADAYSLPLLPHKAVFMGDVFEHLEHPDAVLRQIWKVLEPDGILYLTTPPPYPVKSEYHFKEYTASEIESEVVACGFALQEPIRVVPELFQQYAKFRKVFR